MAARRQRNRIWPVVFGKSQALLDEVAVLAFMTYVDLNPIRAVMADNPESSDFTAIQERLGFSPPASEVSTKSTKEPIPEAPLLAFDGMIASETTQPSIPFHFTDYLELVDWTGRVIRADKRGHIPTQLPPILQRLNIDTKQWLNASEHFERDFYYAIGPISKLNQFCEKLDKYWLHGKTACHALYAKPHPA
jgi:hypothetical protein